MEQGQCNTMTAVSVVPTACRGGRGAARWVWEGPFPCCSPIPWTPRIALISTPDFMGYGYTPGLTCLDMSRIEAFPNLSQCGAQGMVQRAREPIGGVMLSSRRVCPDKSGGGVPPV